MTTRLLAESPSFVKNSIRMYMCIKEIQEWNTLALVKHVLEYYAMADVQDDVRTFTACYETVLKEYAHTSDSVEKAEEAGRQLKVFKEIMQAGMIK